jgi:tRNA (guanine37-N1)-methyltransferase
LEHAQYTRPREFRGLTVPEVLLGGNHEEIGCWRLEQSLQKTSERRADLLDNETNDARTR